MCTERKTAAYYIHIMATSMKHSKRITDIESLRKTHPQQRKGVRHIASIYNLPAADLLRRMGSISLDLLSRPKYALPRDCAAERRRPAGAELETCNG